MQNKISLLLPSRGRPLLVRRLFQSIVDQTEDLSNIEIIMYLDDDDTESHHIEDQRLNIVKIIGPRSTMGYYNTMCLNRSSGELVMLMNDDLVICTKGWDQLILDHALSIPNGIFMAYPYDMVRTCMSTFPIMNKKTCDILSKPYPVEYDNLFIDAHILDIFLRLKHLGKDHMFFLDKVIFDHRRLINGKPRLDASYSYKSYLKDAMTFISLRNSRQVSAQRLLAAIEGNPLPKFNKDISMENPPTNLFNAISKYFSVFCLDRGLPLKQRLRLFAEFTNYYAAMKSGFRILKRKSYIFYKS